MTGSILDRANDSAEPDPRCVLAQHRRVASGLDDGVAADHVVVAAVDRCAAGDVGRAQHLSDLTAGHADAHLALQNEMSPDETIAYMRERLAEGEEYLRELRDIQLRLEPELVDALYARDVAPRRRYNLAVYESGLEQKLTRLSPINLVRG